jgi:hypothetical protein
MTNKQLENSGLIQICFALVMLLGLYMLRVIPRQPVT